MCLGAFWCVYLAPFYSKLPLSVHAEVWSGTWKWYTESWADSFAWGRRRKEEARKKATMEKINTLQGVVQDVREATHNTPEVLVVR